MEEKKKKLTNVDINESSSAGTGEVLLRISFPLYSTDMDKLFAHVTVGKVRLALVSEVSGLFPWELSAGVELDERRVERHIGI